ncbi:hypothetical protein BU24DRAFT_419114 [Aaosphaeria arxii CBS 175.79]|uniref:Uncharacterized protein n=1 Tax=Aaosphaeria arxii CBS 175.79 TaxID=1450172 RepID=A0A6A5Y391_9PLEO|nr:uncharacterized protein BU24DRAFT_419114 [Aaosphaeria arxii CBS 175.79]KAF2019497.1 hypothetical protein BU24DRAFT_419114 [Aaosphaeria arxii CBS 175.79]
MRAEKASSTWDGSRRSWPEGSMTPKDQSRDPAPREQSDQGLGMGQEVEQLDQGLGGRIYKIARFHM